MNDKLKNTTTNNTEPYHQADESPFYHNLFLEDLFHIIFPSIPRSPK
jgi:hypothetical protein